MPDRELDVLVADHLLERLARPLSLEQVLDLAVAEPDDPLRERGSALLLARDHLVTTDAPVDLLDLVLARAEDRRLQAAVGRSLLTLALGGIRSSWPALVARARTSDRWATALGHAWPGPALAAELPPDLWAFVAQDARARAAGLLADGDGVLGACNTSSLMAWALSAGTVAVVFGRVVFGIWSVGARAPVGWWI